MRPLVGLLDYFQAQYPKLASASHWVNPTFTVGTFTLTHDVTLKVAAFLFVTVPLGIIQWWNLYDRWQERRAKKHGRKE